MSLHQQIRALRATAASMLAQLEALESSADAMRESEPCEHPERARSSHVATFDNPGRWQCRRCGHIGGEQAAPSKE
jgi:hypothetical protein